MLQKSMRAKKRVVALYLLVPLIVYVFSVFVPLITAFVDSFFEWKGGPQKTFNGIQNYITLFQDATFWQSFWHNIYLVAICIVGQIGIAFIFVLMIDSKLVKLKGMHRTFGFFPSTISAVCVGFIWKMIYDYNRGILNWFLKLIGHADAAKVWLNEPDKVMLLVSIPLIWQYIGYYMVILLSGIASIDKEIFESAEIDGAGRVRCFFKISLPLMMPTFRIILMLALIGSLGVFDNIWVLTAGGPQGATTTMSIMIYKRLFGGGVPEYGYTAALSSISAVISGILTVIYLAFSKKSSEIY